MAMLWLLALASAWCATLAVMPFDNRTGDEANDVLGVGVADMLLTDLGQLRSLTLVERARLRDVLAELALAETGFLDPKTAAKAGKGVGAKWVVVGAISAIEPNLRLDARIVDVESGTILGRASAKGPRSDFFDVEKELALAVTDELGIAVSMREAAKVGRVQTESFDAFRAWSQGLVAIDRGEVEQARTRFEAALAFDSGFQAATDALTSVRTSVQRAEEVRAERYDQRISTLLALIDDVAAQRASVSALEAALLDVRATYHTFPASLQIVASRRILELDLPESSTVGPGAGNWSTNEFALGTLAMAAALREDRALFLSWGPAYLKRYPTGTWYQTLKVQLDYAMSAIEAERTAEADPSVRLTIQADEHAKMLRRRCTREPDVRKAADACVPFLEWALDLPIDPNELRNVASGLRAGAHVDALRTLVKVGRHYDLSLSKIDDWTEDIERIERTRAALPEARTQLEGKIAARKPVSRRLMDPFVHTAQFDEALTWIDRLEAAGLRDRDDANALRWSIYDDMGDVDAMRRLHESLEGVERPFKTATLRLRDIGYVQAARAEVAQSLAERDLAIAYELNKARRYRDAAKAYEAALEAHPDHPMVTDGSVLFSAAQAWNSAYGTDALDRARALYVRYLEAYPEGSNATYAQGAVNTLPR